jgi:putative molybdopterin biosynthesis protein
MDGFAVRSIDTAGISDRDPLVLVIGSQSKYLDTGDPLPDWADAVVPIEQVEPVGGGENRLDWTSIIIRTPFSPWSHVRLLGEDIVATELVIPAGHKLRPVDLGAVAGSGHQSVIVRRKPRVAILPTGSELVRGGASPKPGEIIEFNSLVIAAQIEQWGGQPTRFEIIPDDFDQIQAKIQELMDDHDLILILAGSSAGSEDYTARVVASLGEVLVHGVAVRPGHPVILGLLEHLGAEGTQSRFLPVIGVPGYPVSAALTGEIFIEPLLARWLGREPNKPRTIKAIMTRKVHSKMGDDEYLRVTVGKVGDRVIAAPLSRGAGTITSLVRADGIVRIPSGIQGLQAGDQVKVDLYRTREDIDKTILVLGSHDLTIDLIAQRVAMHDRRLSSANLGSLGGLVALRRNEAHLAGCHLLDPETGEYNLSYIQEMLPDLSVTVVTLVHREQGLILPRGNPKGINSLESLRREDVDFINRQRGSGTRLLLDYQLNQLAIAADDVPGYEWEEYTHMNVAAAVASGRADCGLGIFGAANALELDFLPLFQERYDLVIPNIYYRSDLLKPLLDLLPNSSFQAEVAAIPGYDTSEMGQVVTQLDQDSEPRSSREDPI